jgi:hypothetical protein
LAETAAEINARPAGIKSRCTHPGMSSDGLGTHIGRIRNATSDGDRVTADLFFSRAAHNTPDGDLAQYVLTLAAEDPAAFGLSIVCDPDPEAERDFLDQHMQNTDDGPRFVSPDQDNEANLPHVRLRPGGLLAADAVDSPAANPTGLFHRQSVAAEAEALACYCLGLAPSAPPIRALSVDPDRAAQFLRRFLHRHNLTIHHQEPTPMSDPDTTTATPEPEPATPSPVEQPPPPATAEPEPELAAPPPVEQPPPPATPEPEPELAAADPRAELRRYIETFGDKDGPTFYLDAVPFEDGLRRQLEALKADNARLRELIEHMRGDACGATFVPDDQRTRTRFRDLVKIAGADD